MHLQDGTHDLIVRARLLQRSRNPVPAAGESRIPYSNADSVPVSSQDAIALALNPLFGPEERTWTNLASHELKTASPKPSRVMRHQLDCQSASRRLIDLLTLCQLAFIALVTRVSAIKHWVQARVFRVAHNWGALAIMASFSD